ncbi:MAG: iron ABC transporter permease [Actinomycetota bacterium]
MTAPTSTPTAGTERGTAALPADPRTSTTRITIVVLTVVTVIAFVASVWWGTGSVKLTPSRVWTALFDADNAPRIDAVAAEARLVRAVMAVLVGMALASAGALLQTLYQNPLASPEITGVTQGSILAVVMWLVLGPRETDSVWLLPLIGALGGLASGLLTYGIARLGGKIEPLRLILIGVLLGGLLFSLLSVVLISADGFGLELISWTVGSLNSATWDRVRIMAVTMVVCLPLVVIATPFGNALSLGDDIAQGTGLAVARARGVVLFAAAAVTAAAVSLVGGIGFVGLVAPHLVRRRTGADLRRLVPAAAIAGALLVLLADFAARNLRPREFATLFGVTEYVAPQALPTGVYLALIGAPFFIHLLRRSS